MGALRYKVDKYLGNYSKITVKISQHSFLVCSLITVVNIITVLESTWYSVNMKISDAQD